MGAEIHDFALPIRNRADLWEFVRLAFGVKIPRRKICPHHCAPFDAFADAYFAESGPVSIWKASRGFGGKSFMASLLGLVEALTLKCDVNILGGSGEQAKRVNGYMQAAFSTQTGRTLAVPAGVGSPDVLATVSPDMAQRSTRLLWGNTITALMASQASVRGPHPARLLVDEVDEVKQSILDSALGQPMTQRGVRAHTTLSSTHQYPAGTMTNMLNEAGKRGWRVFQWCYRENLQTAENPDGWLTQREVDDKRNTVSVVMWNTEFELQEPAAGNRAIDPAAVGRMFDRALGEYEGAEFEYIETEPPVPGAFYASGADWARKQDYTIIWTFRTDVTPKRLVAFERCNRIPWPLIVKKFDDRVQRFPGTAWHDGTGLGDVVASYMQSDAYPFVFAGRPRADLLSRFIAAVEHDEIRAPFIKFAHNEYLYATVESVYGSNEHLPDTISAGALANAAAGYGWAAGAAN